MSQILLKAPSTLSLRCSGVSCPPSLTHRSSFSVVSAGMVIPENNLLISLNGPLLENPWPSSVSLRSYSLALSSLMRGDNTCWAMIGTWGRKDRQTSMDDWQVLLVILVYTLLGRGRSCSDLSLRERCDICSSPICDSGGSIVFELWRPFWFWSDL